MDMVQVGYSRSSVSCTRVQCASTLTTEIALLNNECHCSSLSEISIKIHYLIHSFGLMLIMLNTSQSTNFIIVRSPVGWLVGQVHYVQVA